MRSISKKIFMEFVFFAIVFVTLIVSNNFIVNSVSTKEEPLREVQVYKEIDRDKYRLDGVNGTAPKIQENLYQISNSQIEGFVKSKNYLPGRIDPFGNTSGTDQAQSNAADTSKDGSTTPNVPQQTQAQSSAAATPDNSQANTASNPPTNTSATNGGNPISPDNSDMIDLKELPKR